MNNKLTFLGTGGSLGVPMVGCTCEVCSSTLSENKRLRPSVLLSIGYKQFLIDAGPDFRTQALRRGITRLDGLLFTHAHHDHTGGIDDLRPLYFLRRSPLPVLLSRATADEIQGRFHYLFAVEGSKKEPHFTLQFLEGQSGLTIFEGIPIQFVSYIQAGMQVNGYRVGNLAYLSDIKEYHSSIFDELKGVKYLVISAIRHTPSPLHFSVDEAVDFARRLNVEKAWLTHVCHELEHCRTNAYLPNDIRLAYDGLEITFD